MAVPKMNETSSTMNPVNCSSYSGKSGFQALISINTSPTIAAQNFLELNNIFNLSIIVSFDFARYPERLPGASGVP
jgi:hypothetical protein